LALYILGCGVIGLVAVSLLTDYTNRDVSQKYEGVEADSNWRCGETVPRVPPGRLVGGGRRVRTVGPSP
jgi:hypothetical protein